MKEKNLKNSINTCDQLGFEAWIYDFWFSWSDFMEATFKLYIDDGI